MSASRFGVRVPSFGLFRSALFFALFIFIFLILFIFFAVLIFPLTRFSARFLPVCGFSYGCAYRFDINFIPVIIVRRSAVDLVHAIENAVYLVFYDASRFKPGRHGSGGGNNNVVVLVFFCRSVCSGLVNENRSVFGGVFLHGCFCFFHVGNSPGNFRAFRFRSILFRFRFRFFRQFGFCIFNFRIVVNTLSQNVFLLV